MKVIKGCYLCHNKINMFHEDTFSYHDGSNPNKKVHVCKPCLKKKLCKGGVE